MAEGTEKEMPEQKAEEIKEKTETGPAAEQETASKPEAEAAKPEAEAAEAGAAGDGAEEAPEQAAEVPEEAEQKEQPEKKGKPDPKDQKIEELTDKYKRLFAEFDNYRKRTEAEKSSMYGEGQRAVLEKILPVVDNFERAVGSVPEELKGSSYVEGVEKIYRSCMDTLKALGVEPIEAKGQPFDANLHNAVMHVEDEAYGENEIVEEFQRGYKFRDKVLRYSMVKVAN